MEKAGLPAISLVAPAFVRLAHSKRIALGLPEFQPVILRYEGSPVHYGRTPDEVRERAATVYDLIVQILSGRGQRREVAQPASGVPA
ncbi:MAG: hypothetical protein AAB289_04860 [Chloroflexota bacterium]